MPDICRTDVAKEFTVRPETIELLPIKPEAGGAGITGAAIATGEEPRLVPFNASSTRKTDSLAPSL